MTPTSGRPDHSVLAGSAPGAYRRQPGRCRGGKPDLRGRPTQPCEYRSIGDIAVQKLCAQAVDQQYAGPGDVGGQRDVGLESNDAHGGQH